MIKKLLCFILFIFFLPSSYSQCAQFTGTIACNTAAPTVIGNSITCTPPAQNGGRRNFEVTNMIAGATYAVSNCGSGYDTQLTIYDNTGTSVDYNDDGGPECAGTASSIHFVPPADGDYSIQLNRWNCATANNLNGDIVVTLLADPPPPVTNDDCSNAISLTPELLNCTYTTFSNSGATDSGVTDPGCANYSGGDVWFSIVVPDSGELTVDTQTGVVTDSGMAMYTGTCGALTLLECDDDGSINGFMSSITQTGLTPGDTVYVRVWEYGNNNNGTFGICASTTISPGTNGVTICAGEPSQPMTSDIICTAAGSTSLGGSYTGNLDAATDPVAEMPLIFIESADPCAFEPETSNYTSVNFTVTVTGTYIFAMDTPTPYFDAMGYIVVNDGNFVPGSCATGTWIAGDDDDGPDLDPQITANLTAGVSYTLYTTKFSFGDTTHTGPFTWNISTPAVDVEWYTSATGGTAIGSGSVFDPVGVAGSGLTDTNTAGTTTFWAGCPGSSDPREQADYVINNCVTCKTWTGAANSTNWYDPTNWSPSIVPTSADCVIIAPSGFDPVLTYPGPPVPPTPGEAMDITVQTNANLVIDNDKVLTIGDWLTIETGATVTVNAEADLVVQNAVTIQGTGILDILSSGSLIQVDDAAVNSGDIRMQRTVTDLNGDDYIYWSSPVTNFDVGNISPGTDPNLIWEWNPTVGNNFGEWINASGAMTLGKGYIVRDVIGTATADTPLFTGVANNGIITRTINRGTYTGADYNGPGDTMVTAEDDNWNLIGNPYPSAISYSDFISNPNNTTIDGTIYIWTHQNPPSAINSPFYEDYFYNYSPNDYIDNNYTGSNPPGFNGYIGAGQSFFVLMLDTGSQTESVTFNNAMRGSTNDNSIFYSPNNDSQDFVDESNDRNIDIERHRIWLDLITSDGFASSILVGYIEGATNGDDRLYDGYEFAGAPISFYSISDNKAMSIQGRAIPFANSDLVPLGVVIPQNNTYSIAINSFDGLFETTDQEIYLEDIYTGIIHDLRAAPYDFSSASGTFEDRFILRYTNDTLGLTETEDHSGISIISSNGDIIVTSGNQPIKDITVYDLLGRVIITINDLNTLEHTISDLQLSKSVYVTEVTLHNNKQKIKKIIN